MPDRRFWTFFGLIVCHALTGCGGPGPLVINKKQPPYAPWCGPNRRVQVGQRVVGHVHDGPKYKDFLIDETGKEHDPEKIAEQTWAYLVRTGDAKRIVEAFKTDANPTTMPVVSINPLVVILETFPDPAWQKQPREFASKDWYWRAQIQPNSDPKFKENMQWFSPELKLPPTKLIFSEAGVAEIRLPKGTIKLARSGELCKSTRE
jgi:hypothetical protein